MFWMGLSGFVVGLLLGFVAVCGVVWFGVWVCYLFWFVA